MDFGGTAISSASPKMMANIRRCLGLRDDPDPQFPYFDDVIQKCFGIDFRAIYLKTPGGAEPVWATEDKTDAKTPDEWGISNYADERDNPLRDATRADLDKYTWPDPYDPRRIDGLREYAKQLYHNTDYALVGQHFVHGFVEGGCRLRGYDQFLTDLALDQDFVRAFFDKMLELMKKFTDVYLTEIGEYIQIIWIGDDACTQRGPYMSPELYRKLVKPYFAEYIKAIKSKTKARIMHHCCGSCLELIGDYIDIGIDILNPIQPEAEGMDPDRLKRQFGRQLSFHGGIGLQQVLTRGSTRDVEDTVKSTFATLGPGGGYILAAAHSLSDDVPPENVITLFETGKNCLYPVSPMRPRRVEARE